MKLALHLGLTMPYQPCLSLTADPNLYMISAAYNYLSAYGALYVRSPYAAR